MTVQPGGKHIEEAFGNPDVKPTTLRFFLGDSNTPVKIYDGMATEPTDQYTFQPISAGDSARPGRIQALQIQSSKDKTGEVSLRIFNKVDPTCLDMVSDSKDSCLSGCGTSVRFTGSLLTGALDLGRAAVVNSAWTVRHPILAGQNAVDGTVRMLGGTPADRTVVADGKDKSA